MLSATELVSQAGRVKTKLLLAGSKMTEGSEISEEDRAHMQRVKDNFQELCSFEKINRADARSVGHYEKDQRRVRVEKLCGKTHRHLGTWIHNVRYFEPHEALYLIETNDLVVYFEGQIVSIEQAYHIFGETSGGLSTEKYFAFSNLMRKGHVVKRHKKVAKIDASKLSVNDQILLNLKRNLGFINQRDVLNVEIPDSIASEFQSIKRSFLEGTSPNEPSESPLKKLRTEPVRVSKDLPEKNEMAEFSSVFHQLDIIGTFEPEIEESNEKEAHFDFDVFESVGKKLKERPEFYVKVLNCRETVDNEEVLRLVRRALGTKVMLVVVFENLSVSFYEVG